LRVCRSAAEVRTVLGGAPRPVGFVPTMGALHAGHEALLERCRAECPTAVASLFVNPLQFDEADDLARYPRPFGADLDLLREHGVAVVYAPEAGAMYPEGFSTTVDVGPLATVHEGASRAGHFAGVATVVLKLFHAVGPDFAYFGRKDAQQLAVLARMTRDLDLAVGLVPVDTVRDPDGLALSSRNARLSDDERARALGLPRGLFRARDAWAAGERDPERLVALARDPDLAYDYLAVVDEADFGPPREGRPALVVAAARVGATRLIDNVALEA